jgi:glycosyltransferase involved in cell wall biosynthesis
MDSVEEECKKSKKILIYTGFSRQPWNYSTLISEGLGGAETCVCRLAEQLAADYDVYIAGGVAGETFGNIIFIGFDKLQEFLKTTMFYAVIVSRYIGFLEDYTVRSYKLYLWIHDLNILSYAWNRQIDRLSTINKWDSTITAYICLTNWHRDNTRLLYPFIEKSKIKVIPNGLSTALFPQVLQKKRNHFVFTSCPERGYARILELWPAILKELPDATLSLATYVSFPRNEFETAQMMTIQAMPGIRFLGKLNPEGLYQLLGTTEYWLYPTDFLETFCITGLEMLRSGTICLYYPVAALNDTVGEYGIRLQRGSEIEAIGAIARDEDQKKVMIQRGLEYADRFDWLRVYELWSAVLSA